MENFEMTSLEMSVAEELFPMEDGEAILDSENFPTKDRSKKADKRKKTYFKGKKRYDMIRAAGYAAIPGQERVVRGMTRKTSILHSDIRNGGYFETSRGNIRRTLTANDKMAEYAMEVC